MFSQWTSPRRTKRLAVIINIDPYFGEARSPGLRNYVMQGLSQLASGQIGADYETSNPLSFSNSMEIIEFKTTFMKSPGAEQAD